MILAQEKISLDTYLDWVGRVNLQYLRLGQAFLNDFYPSVTDPDLYYQTDYHRCQAMIFDKYVNHLTG